MKLPLLALLAMISAAACGGSGAEQPKPTLATAASTAAPPPAVTADRLEKDPLGLFPAGALGMFAIDTKAFYASQSTGPLAAKLAEKFFPVGAEAGFSPSRDLDRVTAGVYSMQGADALVALAGRFDPAKIQQLADSKTQIRGGGVVAASQYAGRTLYTVADVGFIVVSPHLVLAGTKTTLKRALDRMRDGRFTHDAPAWMIATLATPGAAVAVALDTKSVPLSSMTGGLPLKGTDGMTALRLLGNFQPPGMHAAGAATYADEAHAKAGAAGLESLFGSSAFSTLLSMIGISVRDVKITPAKDDAQIAFTIDDASMRNFLSRLPALLGG